LFMDIFLRAGAAIGSARTVQAALPIFARDKTRQQS
jgi:hypothetical protein